MAAVVGAAVVMPLAYEEASKPFLTPIENWASLNAYNRPDINPGDVRVLGAFQRCPRAFVYGGGPR